MVDRGALKKAVLMVSALLAVLAFFACDLVPSEILPHDNTADPENSIYSYTVTFVSNGGSAVVEQTVEGGGLVSEPYPAPARSLYTFIGWYSDSDLTAAWDFAGDTVKADMTLYAKWAVTEYTVTFESNGGSTVSDQTVVEGGQVPRPADPIKPGENFVAWYSDDSLTSAWSFLNDTVTADITLYAKWSTLDVFRVDFEPNGGDALEYQNVISGDPVIEPDGIEKTGYTLLAWYSDAGFATVWDFLDPVTEATTLYAKWEANTYLVTLNLQGGTVGMGGDSVNATYNDAMPLGVPAPTLTGYTFEGYYTGIQMTGTQYYTAGMESAKTWDIPSDTTLYAGWSASEYTVTFDKQGGSGGSVSVTATYDAPMPAATAPTRTGYTFEGYFDEPLIESVQYYDAGMNSVNDWDIASDWALYAVWTANTYTVTFDTQGGTGGSVSVTATYDADMPAATAPNQAGHTFGGYYAGTNGTGTQYYDGRMESVHSWDIPSGTGLYAYWHYEYEIGDPGPAGGLIFYDNGEPETYGWRYLESAPADTEWEEKVWGGWSYEVGTTETYFGYGESNTEAIVGEYGSAEPYGDYTDYAAKLCYDLMYGGYDDWFLPSQDELELMYTVLHQAIPVPLGDFTIEYYWSSSEETENYAYIYRFSTGDPTSGVKFQTYGVRAVRSF